MWKNPFPLSHKTADSNVSVNKSEENEKIKFSDELYSDNAEANEHEVKIIQVYVLSFASQNNFSSF